MKHPPPKKKKTTTQTNNKQKHKKKNPNQPQETIKPHNSLCFRNFLQN